MSDNSKQAYVFLDVGDVIHEGDECWLDGSWHNSECVGGTIHSDEDLPYRRPVTFATPNPVGQPGAWDAYALAMLPVINTKMNVECAAQVCASFADEMMKRRPKEVV